MSPERLDRINAQCSQHNSYMDFVTCQKLEHLLLLLFILSCLFAALLPLSESFPGESCLQTLPLDFIYVWQKSTDHFLVARLQKSDMIQHLREKPGNICASTEAEEEEVSEA